MLLYIANKIKEDHDEFDALEQRKPRFKLLAEIEKARKALSVDDEAFLQVNDFSDDIDLDY